MTTEELIDERARLKILVTAIDAAINSLITQNKKYTYSNVEATHMAETHSLSELSTLRKTTWDQYVTIDNQLKGSFVKLKNYR